MEHSLCPLRVGSLFFYADVALNNDVVPASHPGPRRCYFFYADVALNNDVVPSRPKKVLFLVLDAGRWCSLRCTAKLQRLLRCLLQLATTHLQQRWLLKRTRGKRACCSNGTRT